MVNEERSLFEPELFHVKHSVHIRPAVASDASKSWRLIGFGETHCAMENGFDRVYMRWEF